MNAGMELMGMKECRECGDPYTPAEPDTGVCSCCIMSHEVAALRARVAELEEGNVRRQVALEARAETAERDLDMARGLISRLGDPDALESLWALLRYERARVAELERAQDAAFRDAHRAEADAARLREALTQVRDAMLATGQEPDGDDDPRRPVAAAVWRALASAPSAEPVLPFVPWSKEREMTDSWRQVGQHAAHPELDATPSAEPTPRAKAEAFFAGFAGDDDAGVLAWSEPRAEPTPRDMRVAEAVRARIARHIRISPRFEGQLTTPNDNGLLGRVAQEVENLNLAAVLDDAINELRRGTPVIK